MIPLHSTSLLLLGCSPFRPLSFTSSNIRTRRQSAAHTERSRHPDSCGCSVAGSSGN